ncbi:MAG TPA: hypothetical protein VG347_00045, partial [Verrucomicrobiae bacterium]|nr:hypothetical protein [Verrucomicrobiae bacterium]
MRAARAEVNLDTVLAWASAPTEGKELATGKSPAPAGWKACPTSEAVLGVPHTQRAFADEEQRPSVTWDI